jgi:ubiquinone biosynthesis protein UbiJ
VSPLLTALTRWVELLANESAQLDPLMRVRLGSLAGRSIAFELEPPGETATLHFDAGSIRLSPGVVASPSVIVKGSPRAMAAAFLGTNTGRDAITIDGDDVILSEFRSIVRDFRPEILSPLATIVGSDAAQTITGVVELGVATLVALGRSIRDEGGRFARDEARQRYLTVSQFDAFLKSVGALRIRIDRLVVRTDIVEGAQDGDHE